MLFVTEVLINEIRKFDPEISVMNPKDCMFRIFRDVRFSNDKRPYKTNFGVFIAKGGRKSMHPGYYLHIEPNSSFAGGGIYMPPAEPLKAIRNYLASHGDEFLELINNKDFRSIYPEMHNHQLKTAPKGFPKDHPYIDLLRYKSIVFSTSLENNLITSEIFIEFVVNTFRQLQPVNEVINQVLDKSY
jgi:uncharacterized protein (TIGR02453 family)